MWEVFTCGKMPYGRLKNTEVVERVQRGIILERPKACFKEVYEVSHRIFQLALSPRPMRNCFKLTRFAGDAQMLGALSGSTTVFPRVEGSVDQRFAGTGQRLTQPSGVHAPVFTLLPFDSIDSEIATVVGTVALRRFTLVE